MNFREAFTDDLEGFLDIEEFAQIHLIEGSEVKAIVKNVSNSKKESGYKDRNYYGISQSSKLLIAKEEELFDYKNGDRIDLDGVYYDVSKVDKVMGMSKILLERIEWW